MPRRRSCWSQAALAASKGEAARLIKGGGVYVNNRRVADERARLTRDQAIGGQVFVLRKGQRQYHLVKLETSVPMTGTLVPLHVAARVKDRRSAR